MEPSTVKPNVPGVPDEATREPQYDAGVQSLARALRISFVILTVVMVLLFVGYLASGFYTVEPQQVAIQLHFGKKHGDPRGPGIHWAWPFPIDEVVKFDAMKNQSVDVNSFWYATADQTEAELRQEREELRHEQKPEKVKGAGGYNLTGDLNIIHTYWKVTYIIDDSVAYLQNIRYGTDMDERLLIKCVVEDAVIRTVGRLKVYDALSDKAKEVAAEVTRLAREQLGSRGLNTGISIQQVLNSPLPVVPPTVAGAFYNATAARQNMNTAVEGAAGYRKLMLGQTAGAVAIESGDLSDPRGLGDLFTELGETQEVMRSVRSNLSQTRLDIEAANSKLAQASAEERTALETRIGDLKNQAEALAQREKDLDAKLAALPVRIDELYKRAGAEVETMKAAANDYCRSVVESAKGDAAAIESLRDKFPDEPEKLSTFLNHYRLQVLEEVLSRVDDKYLLPASVEGTKSRIELSLTPPPELLQQKRKLEETR